VVGSDDAPDGDQYEFLWQTSALTGGAHTAKARAHDTSGNVTDASATVTILTGNGPTLHGEDISGAESWAASGNPHVVTASIRILGATTLTIQPGCVIQFRPGTGLACGDGTGAVASSIVALGTADSTIVFTSGETPPQPGDWNGIHFRAGTGRASRFSFCEIAYAGAADSAAVGIAEGAGARFDRCSLHGVKGNGIRCFGTGRLEQFTENTVTGCSAYPLRVFPEGLRFLGAGNLLDGNAAGFDGILVEKGEVTTNATWSNHGVPYFVAAGATIAIGADRVPVVTVAAGTELRFFPGASIEVGALFPGGLVADGTEGVITFRSAAASPAPGDWDGLAFLGAASDGGCRLVNCVVEHAGGAGSANIRIKDSLPTISGCTIRSSAGWGITLGGAEHPDPVVLEGANTFSGCAAGSVHQF
jgi:hypothetical protein